MSPVRSDREQILAAVDRVAKQSRRWHDLSMRRIDRLREELHLAVGTDPRSPRYEGDGDKAGKGRRRVRPDRRRPMWLSDGEHARTYARAKESRAEWRRHPVRNTVRAAERVPYVGRGVTACRIVFWALLVGVVLGWVVFHWAVAPVWHDVRTFGQAVAPDFDDDFGPEDLPEWHRRIIPGAFEACPGLQPVAAEPRPVGGARGVATATGGMFRGLLDSEPTPAGVRDTVRGFFVGVGRAWGDFTLALEGATPAPAAVPVQPSSLTVPADMSTKRLSDVEVAELARAVGWPEREVPMVVARVKAESGGDPRARDYVDGSHQGLLQMGQAEQRQYMPGEDPFDPRANLRGARKLWEARGWQPWRASDSAVGQHLEAGRRAAAAGGVAPAPSVPVVDCGGIQLASMGPVGDLTPQNAAEAELSRNAIRARRAILAEFPGTTIGGWGTRPNRTEHDDRDHTGKKAARALDVMTYTDMGKGHRVASWVRANWDALNLEYMIWDRRIYVSPDHSRPYRGASPHTDHPHLTFSPDGVDVNA